MSLPVLSLMQAVNESAAEASSPYRRALFWGIKRLLASSALCGPSKATGLNTLSCSHALFLF